MLMVGKMIFGILAGMGLSDALGFIRGMFGKEERTETGFASLVIVVLALVMAWKWVRSGSR